MAQIAPEAVIQHSAEDAGWVDCRRSSVQECWIPRAT